MPDPNDRPAQGDAETARASAAAEDVIWVARCLRGDSQAFERLVTKHQRVLFTVAFRLLGDYEDARDATQNAFIRAFTKLDTFDPSRFFSWICGSPVNECLICGDGAAARPPGLARGTGAGDRWRPRNPASA